MRDSDVMTASSPRPFSPGFSATVARRVIVKDSRGVELEAREMKPDSTVSVTGPDTDCWGLTRRAAGVPSVTTNDATRDVASRTRNLPARG